MPVAHATGIGCAGLPALTKCATSKRSSEAASLELRIRVGLFFNAARLKRLKTVPMISNMPSTVAVQTETTMRLMLPILLIPMVLASQSLCAVHSYIGTHSAELDGHGGTPHFHADAGHGHSHSHHGLQPRGGDTSEVPQSGIEEFPDHNVVAYYVPDSVSRGDKRLALEKLSGLHGKFVGQTLPSLLFLTFAIPKTDRPRPYRLCVNARVPLFLRDASIRC